jgi:HlyD family secretion protein
MTERPGINGQHAINNEPGKRVAGGWPGGQDVNVHTTRRWSRDCRATPIYDTLSVGSTGRGFASMCRSGKIGPGLILSVVLNLALACGVGYLLYSSKFSNPSSTSGGMLGTTGTSSPIALNEVNSLGRIQPGGGLVSVFGPPGDRVSEFQVNVGDTVAADQKLATLAGEEDRKLQLQAIDSQIKEAEALRTSIEASKKAKLADIDAEAKQATVGVEQDTRAIDAKVKAVEAQMKRATAERNRLIAAKAEGVRVSEQELEQVESLYAQAEAEREASLAQKEKIRVTKEEAGKSIVAKKATVEAETNRALAQVPLESLRTNRLLAERKLKDGELRSATGGRVVRILTKAGDTITNQPILQIADPSRMVVLAEVYETDVGRVREWLAKGPVKAEIDARVLSADRKLTGTVSGPAKVSSVISKNILTPLGPREDADRRVVEVEVDLDSASAAVAKDFIGLQVRVRLLSGDK